MRGDGSYAACAIGSDAQKTVQDLLWLRRLHWSVG